MKIFKLFFYLIIIVAGAAFSCLNSDLVTIKYYFGVKEMPLSILLALVFGIGSILGLLFGWISVVKLKMTNRRLQKNLNSSQQEISKLRLLSVQD